MDVQAKASCPSAGQRALAEAIVRLGGEAAGSVSPRNPGQVLNRVLCRDRDTTFVIDPKDILYFKSDRGCTVVKTLENEYLANDSLSFLEMRAGSVFVRIHRNALVNTAHVSCLRHENSDVYVVLRGGTDLPVSRRHVNELKQRLRFGAD